MVDPGCRQSVDVIVLYTPAFKGLLNGSEDSVLDAANQAVNTANEALTNSRMPPNQRFRLVGVESSPMRKEMI